MGCSKNWKRCCGHGSRRGDGFSYVVQPGPPILVRANCRCVENIVSPPQNLGQSSTGCLSYLPKQPTLRGKHVSLCIGHLQPAHFSKDQQPSNQPTQASQPASQPTNQPANQPANQPTVLGLRKRSQSTGLLLLMQAAAALASPVLPAREDHAGHLRPEVPLAVGRPCRPSLPSRPSALGRGSDLPLWVAPGENLVDLDPPRKENCCGQNVVALYNHQVKQVPNLIILKENKATVGESVHGKTATGWREGSNHRCPFGKIDGFSW